MRKKRIRAIKAHFEKYAGTTPSRGELRRAVKNYNLPPEQAVIYVGTLPARRSARRR